MHYLHAARFASVRFNKIFLFVIKIDDLGCQVANTVAENLKSSGKMRSRTCIGEATFFTRVRFVNYKFLFVIKRDCIKQNCAICRYPCKSIG